MIEVDLTRRDEPDAEREWLLADGLGGFAMGTPAAIHTRRYHGLLIAAAAPPGRRIVLLEDVAETIEQDGRTIELWSRHFGDDLTLSPDGWRRIQRFDFDISQRSCRWTWRTDELTLARTLTLARQRNQATIAWEARDVRERITIRARLLMPMRPFHALDSDEPRVVSANAGAIEIERDDLRAVASIAAGDAVLVADPQMWRDFAYPRERERGLEWRGDVFSPGYIEARFSPEVECRFAISVQLTTPPIVETDSRVSVVTQRQAEGSIESRLAAAGDQFVVRCRADGQWGTTIIAGYPWFGDWGRDAMISLPGLLLVDGRLDEAGDVLRVFAAKRRNGLIPNCFNDADGEPLYNTVDAGLWFVRAVWEYARAGAEHDEDLVDACRDVIASYRRGTKHGIGVSRDGLIVAGAKGMALTWMDAVRDGEVFTQRDGKAVEINALWHNALRCLADLVTDEDEAAELRELAGHAALSFQMNFWWPQRQCCHDVLRSVERPVAAAVSAEDAFRFQSYQTAHQRAQVETTIEWVGDERLRPNQIIAAAVPFSPLTRPQQRSVIDVVRDCLLTPYGLRTLAPDDPGYIGRFEGDLRSLDAAYHNGTVWPWLIGPYCEALLRAGDFSDDAKREAWQALRPLLDSLDDGCIGQIAEVYDGDPPHRPGGCPAQAWSIAEVRRVWAMIERGKADSEES